MAYSVSTFLRPLSSTDKILQIIDNNGVVKYSINPFTIKHTITRGNVIYMSLNSDREILLDFRSQSESRQALVLLETRLEDLRNKVPNYIDRIVEEYTSSLKYFKGDVAPSSQSDPGNIGEYIISGSDLFFHDGNSWWKLTGESF